VVPSAASCAQPFLRRDVTRYAGIAFSYRPSLDMADLVVL